MPKEGGRTVQLFGLMNSRLSLSFLFVLFVTFLAEADGKYFGAQASDPKTPFQRGLLAFKDGVETLIVESTLTHVSRIRTTLMKVRDFEWHGKNNPEDSLISVIKSPTSASPPEKDVPGGLVFKREQDSLVVTVFDEDCAPWTKRIPLENPASEE